MAGAGYGDCVCGTWSEKRVSPSRERGVRAWRRPATAVVDGLSGSRTSWQRLRSRWRRAVGAAPGRSGKGPLRARDAPEAEVVALSDRRGVLRGRTRRMAGPDRTGVG